MGRIKKGRRKMKSLIPIENVESRIYIIRGQKVMLDRDLAELYGVPTKRLNEQVKRNRTRFPPDFMFKLTVDEALASRSQIATLKQGQNIKYAPLVFTEQGVAMLSTVLNSERAVQVNIAIMRAFVRLRRLLSSNKELAAKLAELERKVAGLGSQVGGIFEAIRQLMNPPEPKAVPPRRIGFRP